MKKQHRILSAVLSVLLSFSLATTAFAEETVIEPVESETGTAAVEEFNQDSEEIPSEVQTDDEETEEEFFEGSVAGTRNETVPSDPDDEYYETTLIGQITVVGTYIYQNADIESTHFGSYSQYQYVTVVGENNVEEGNSFYLVKEYVGSNDDDFIIGYVLKSRIRLLSDKNDGDAYYATSIDGTLLKNADALSSASSSADVVQTASKNSTLSIVAVNGNYYKTASGLYVLRSSVSLKAVPSFNDTVYEPMKVGIVVSTDVAVQDAPSINATTDATLPKGTQTVITGENGAYYRIAAGYISKTSISISEDILYSSSKKATVTTENPQVYQLPLDTSSVSGQLKKNASVVILGENGDYYKISSGYILKTVVKLDQISANGDTLYETSKSGTVVNTTTVNVREKPSTSSKILKVLKKGSTVTVLGENGTFYYVKSGTVSGYIAKTKIKIAAETNSDVIYATAVSGTVENTEKMYVYSKPAYSNTTVASYLEGEELLVLGENGNFYKVLNGYVPKRHVLLDGDSEVEVNDTLYETALEGNLNVALIIREDPSIYSPKVTTLAKGTEVEAVGENGDFYLITANDGDVTGFVLKTRVDLKPIPEEGDTIYETAKTGTIINKTTLNVRKLPNTTSSIVGKVKSGASVSVIGENETFYKITSGSITGYVLKTRVKITTATSTVTEIAYSRSRTATVANTASVNLRSDADTTSSVLSVLKSGDKITVVGEKGTFYKVQVSSKTGYVAKTKVAFSVEIKGDKFYSESKTGKIANTATVNVRRGPATSYQVLQTLKKGTSVVVLGENDTFYITSYGYISKTKVAV